MKFSTNCLSGVVIAGCGTGVSSDPSWIDYPKGTLSSAPTTLQTHVLATAVLAGWSQNDATYVAIVEDPAQNRARLIQQDLRDPTVTELDHMPLGKGVAQIVVGGDGIVWGFGDDGAAPGKFRIAQGGARADIMFGEHAPSHLLFEGRNVLTYTSTRDCAVEQLDLQTAAIHQHGTISCYTTIESVLRAGSFVWIRTEDDPGQSIRQMDTAEYFGPDVLVGGLSSAAGPFPGAESVAWIIQDAQGDSHVISAPTDQWPAPTAEIETIPGAVDAGAFVGGELWGVTLGDPSSLLHVSSHGVIRHAVDYQPRALLGLHGRLLIETVDGVLLDQRLTADD